MFSLIILFIMIESVDVSGQVATFLFNGLWLLYTCYSAEVKDYFYNNNIFIENNNYKKINEIDWLNSDSEEAQDNDSNYDKVKKQV